MRIPIYDKILIDGYLYPDRPSTVSLISEYGPKMPKYRTIDTTSSVILSSYVSASNPHSRWRRNRVQAWAWVWEKDAFMPFHLANVLQQIYSTQKSVWIQNDIAMSRNVGACHSVDASCTMYATPTWPIAPLGHLPVDGVTPDWSNSVFVNYVLYTGPYTIDPEYGIITFPTSMSPNARVAMRYTWRIKAKIVYFSVNNPISLSQEYYQGTVHFEHEVPSVLSTTIPIIIDVPPDVSGFNGTSLSATGVIAFSGNCTLTTIVPQPSLSTNARLLYYAQCSLSTINNGIRLLGASSGVQFTSNCALFIQTGFSSNDQITITSNCTLFICPYLIVELRSQNTPIYSTTIVPPLTSAGLGNDYTLPIPYEVVKLISDATDVRVAIHSVVSPAFPSMTTIDEVELQIPLAAAFAVTPAIPIRYTKTAYFNCVTFTGNCTLYTKSNSSLSSLGTITFSSNCTLTTIRTVLKPPVVTGKGATIAAGGSVIGP